MKRQHSIALLFLVALTLGTISVVCLKAPRAPSWDTVVTLPLLDKTFHLMDVLPHNYFSVGSDSVIQFNAVANIDTIRPIKTLSLSGRPLATSFKLADLTLTGDFSCRVKLGLEEILGMALPEQPALVPVAPFAFSLERQFTVSRIRNAELLRGAAIVRLGNYSNVPIDSARLSSELLGNARFADLAPGRNLEDRRRLGGCRVNPQNHFVLAGSSRGSMPESVWVSRYDSVVVEVAFDSLRLSSAELQMPQARANKKLFLGVTASHSFKLDSVTFARGYAELSFANSFSFPLDVALRIARLGYAENLHLGPIGTGTAFVALTGKSLANNGLTNSLLEVVTQVAVPPDSGYVAVSKDQALTINSTLNDLSPQYLRGELQEPLYITPKQETLPRLLPTGFPALRLPRCLLDLHITSAIGYRGRLNLHITGTNKAGDTACLDQTVYLAPGDPTFPRMTDYTLPLHHVLTIGPEHVRFSYDIEVSGYGSIQAEGYATGQAAISTPLRLALCADTIDLGGKVVEIDQGLRDNIARYLVAGEIQADVGNHFPLGMNACVVLKPEPEDSQRATDTLAIPVGIPGGMVDASRTCQHQADTTVVGAIDEHSLAIFHNRRIRARLLLYTPESDTVEIRHQDFLKITARAVLKLKVGGNND